jgi:site-specific recombinase XerD
MPKKVPPTLNDADLERFLAAPNTRCSTGLRNRAVMAALVGAGLRLSEVINLRVQDVDLERGTIHVVHEKRPKDRDIPIDRDTLGWLQRWAEQRRSLAAKYGFRTDCFFFGVRTRGERLSRNYVEAAFHRYRKRAGLSQRVTPHVLRHTYASRLIKRGFNLLELKELLGHAWLSSTEVYRRLDRDELREKIQRYAAPSKEEIAALAKALMALSPETRRALARAVAGDRYGQREPGTSRKKS